MQIGDNVMWKTSEGETYGQLLAATDTRYTIATGEGEMSFPKGDGLLTRDLLRTYQRAAVQAFAEAPAVTIAVPKAASKTGQLTRYQQAAALYDPNKSRAGNIQAFMETVGLTPGGASTYYSQIKKERTQ